MADIWQQFHQLPRSIRDTVASSRALAAVDKLEATYPQLDVAGFVMRVMVKEIPLATLSEAIQREAELAPPQADAVVAELRKSVFGQVSEYLGEKSRAASRGGHKSNASQRRQQSAASRGTTELANCQKTDRRAEA